jgi:adenylyltransferase/sulfurtransferase
MSIRIAVPSFLQSFAGGNASVEVSGRTVGECLDGLAAGYPEVRKMLFDENGRLRSYVGFYVNGQNAFPEGPSKQVHDGDEIRLLYAIGGG